MFAKKNKDNSIEPTKPNLSGGSKELIDAKEEQLTQVATPRKNTSISSSCHISGDLVLDDDIQIFGHVKGSIRSNNGVVTIQKEGVVEGEIYAQTISINGKMKGLCVSEDLDILENGQLDGICQTKNLTIRKGGIFTGTSERTDKKIQINDVKNKSDIVKLEAPAVPVQ